MKTIRNGIRHSPRNAARRTIHVALAIVTLAGWSVSAATRYVWQDSPGPTPPFDSWAQAATNIQDAVEAAVDGDTVLVMGGVYATGGRAVFGTMTNRVAIDKAVTVESLMGPEVTVIEGAPAPGGGDGDGAVRCVYLGTNAILSGFTLTNGHTRLDGDFLQEQSGGGVWCESSATLTNCIVTGNSANSGGGGVFQGTLYHCALTGNSAASGGGVSQGTLHNCTLTGNSAYYDGGGANGGTLYNCTLTRNSASRRGGGSYDCVLYNCTLTSNSASGSLYYTSGGGSCLGTLFNCTLIGNYSTDYGGGSSVDTLYNCIVYSNTASWDSNYDGGTFNHCCTFPLPSDGTNNIDADPQLATLTHLSSSSPCIGTGSSAYASGLDVDGEPWANPPCIGADQLTPGQATGPLTMGIETDYTSVGPGFAVRFGAINQGPILASIWEFDDGTVVTNQPITTHVWSAPGIYTVRLTGYNDSFPNGVTATVLVEVTENIYYVNLANATPAFPYTSWATAATNIQDAIEAKRTAGGLILVTNGVYASGSVKVEGINRISLAYPIEVRSVNGPEVTVIEGATGIRCAYAGTSAILSGFTLTNGSAEAGGGAWCESSATLTNCILTGNSANHQGGGVYSGTLHNCSVIGNSAEAGGGGYQARLYSCTLTGNSAEVGGGTHDSTLYNCALTGNSASDRGGGYSGGYRIGGGFLGEKSPGLGMLYNCTLTGNSAGSSGGGTDYGTLYNCIVCFNTAPFGPNYDGQWVYFDLNSIWAEPWFDYSCTTPLPTNGVGNITSAPVFVDLPAGDLHLRYGSPGIDAGTNLSDLIITDLDGNPRPLDGDGDGLAAFDMGAYEFDARSIIPADWFTGHGLDPADPQVVSGNPDHDPFTTFQEWLADTDPTNALSFFRIEAISRSSPAMISFLSSSNRTYTLWGTTDLDPANWTVVPSQQAIPGTGGTLTFSDPTNAPQQFYRVEVNLP